MNVKIVLISLFLAARASATQYDLTATVLEVKEAFYFLYSKDSKEATEKTPLTGGCQLSAEEQAAITLDADKLITVNSGGEQYKLLLGQAISYQDWLKRFNLSKDKKLENACQIDIKIVHNGAMFLTLEGDDLTSTEDFCKLELSSFELFEKVRKGGIEFSENGSINSGNKCWIDVTVTDKDRRRLLNAVV